MSTLQNKPEMNPVIAEKFCEACNWAYETWVTHKYLFDLNSDPAATIEKKHVIPFFNRLNIITHEYALQQIARLHDPAEQYGDLNLSIKLVVLYGEWGKKEDDVKVIEKKLNEFWGHTKPARNKILAHNDLKTSLTNQLLGGFPDGEDDKYFAALHELVKAVSARWLGKPYVFNDLVQTEVSDFLNVLGKTN
ncbi:MAG: hypothetical protein ABL951_01815 [Alphaproteobacteria bacterium]